MRDADQTPAAGTGPDRTFFVINLCAAPVPLPLEVPGTAGLDGLVVFRSHQVQDGRHRYRLHLGYFDSREAAKRLLPLVLPRFPTAWIAAAPRSNLGSLDDTGATDFRLIQAPAVSLAEFSAAESAAPGPSVPNPAEEDELQRYAVQLVWSADRTGPADLPPIALFDAYTLYTVTCQRGGVRLYGVRLGFFRSAISATQVAVYVRPDFPSVAVVPVSVREYAYASWLTRHRRRPAARETAQPVRDAAANEPSPPIDEPQTPTAGQPRPGLAPQGATDAATMEPRVPTQVEIARIRSPEAVPLIPLQTLSSPPPGKRTVPPEKRTPPSQHWAHAPRRVPDMDRDARIAALGAHELELRVAKFDRHEERGASLPDMRPYRTAPFPPRRSALARLLSRIADRLG